MHSFLLSNVKKEFIGTPKRLYKYHKRTAERQKESDPMRKHASAFVCILCVLLASALRHGIFNNLLSM